MSAEVVLYDTTLRDGMQGFGLQLTVDHKVRIARRLDALGVPYVEGGWPGANPRDTAVFEALARQPLGQARLAAFGATRRAHVAATEDLGLAATLAAGTPVVTLVGKASRWQVEAVLRTTPTENLAMIGDSVAHAVARGHEVIFDAEHFFDGYAHDAGYALATVERALAAGARWVVLCDTNGGRLPAEVARATAAAAAPGSRPLGIHCHNDIGLAVAATLAAVEAGAQMVQGTINGCGERCGNADLLVVAATLQLKMGRPVLPEERLCELVPVSRLLDTLLDRSPDPHRPYVGGAAFLHKAGLHAQGIAREAMAYQHLEPERVGNRTRTVVSDLSGRASIAGKLRELGLGDLDAATHGRLVERLKGLEVQGWAFEDADASFELLVRRTLAGDVAPFALQDFTVLAHRDQPTVQATVKVQVGDAEVHTAADGNGPVAALDAALRKALGAHFPVFSRVQLADYRVRVIDGDRGTGATVRVGIDSTDGQDHWTTVGCSSNILEASALALTDSYEYAVRRDALNRSLQSA